MEYVTRYPKTILCEDNKDDKIHVDEMTGVEELHLIVTGIAKANILKLFLKSPISEIIPASWIKLHPNLYLWVDEAALSGALIN